ncbi:hypothetical protein ACQ4N7_03365 [Nodosilinea sp. AN01ver1]|uniref:hypothetical protein n=1 Tax=Nodosilinea sp. AN01ver1 TaxID=3423362 RepID=UPI003D3160A7
MDSSNLSFVAKVIALSGGIAAFIKYALPPLLVYFPPGQNSSALAVVIALLLAPSVLMGSLFWLRRSSNPKSDLVEPDSQSGTP